MKKIETWEERLIQYVDTDQMLDAMRDEIAELRAANDTVAALEKAYQDLHRRYVALVEQARSGPTPRSGAEGVVA